MASITRALLWLLTLCLLAGCDAGTEAPSPGPESFAASTGRPHFTGDMDVVLQTGRTVYGGEDCAALTDDDMVCDRAEERAYFVFGEPAGARLVEARMDLSEDATSWTVSLVFSPDSARTLRRYRELARSSGAVVLVLDGAGDALAVAVVTGIEGRRVTYQNLSKPEAWQFVERFQNG